MNRLTISMITACGLCYCVVIANALGDSTDASGRKGNDSMPQYSDSAKSINIDALGRPENDALADVVRNSHIDYYSEPSRVFSQQVGVELEGLTLPRDMFKKSAQAETKVRQALTAQISGANEASGTSSRMFWVEEKGAVVRAAPGGVSLANITPIPIQNSANKNAGRTLTIILVAAVIGTLLIVFEIV